MKLSLVVPCYNDEEVLQLTYQTLTSNLEKLVVVKDIDDYEIIFVDDGSLDRTAEILSDIAGRDKYRVKVIMLNGNYGHQSAILSGILHSSGDAVITIDSDLQDPPQELVNFVREFKKGNDVVIGIRNDRSVDPIFKRIMAEIFYRIARLLGVPGPINAGDYRLISHRAKEILKEYPESNLYLRGLIPSMKLPTGYVSYKRMPRAAGMTGYTFSKQISLAVDGITSFSIKPIRFIGLIGIILLVISFLLIIYIIYQKIANDIPLQGWASLFTAILFFSSINLIFLSVLGEYIGKAYLEIKRRPRYIIHRKINFD